ncbi:3,4-dihydroxy-2-butanone-4-phosphate synthase [Rhodococcus sp. NPDC057529]|uniref:3,4-dihydroxy-2-butanone-4-phosphate synthase n=1 Tax=Rhodococcus sp. NPDC057529 TaxID=3346158 RepID=UPI003672F5DA
MTASTTHPHTQNIDRARGAVARGELVVVTDPWRSVLMLGAETASTAALAEMIRLTSGFVQVALPAAACDRLMIPEASAFWRERRSPTFGQCVAVDAAHQAGTGISAHDRARTIRTLTAPTTVPTDLTRPGHVVPVRVPDRYGEANPFTAAVLDLTIAAGLHPGAAFADLVSPTHQQDMASPGDARELADVLGIAFVEVPGGTRAAGR